MRDDILQALRTRGHNPGNRIGSAARYLKRMANAIGEAQLAEHLKTNPTELKGAINLLRSRKQLTWFDDSISTPAAVFSKDAKAADGALVKITGTPLIKQDGDYTLSGGSIMDFDCTITTARRDRDGDVLEPKGAIVDQKMALLWQHVPYQPIGRMVRLLEQDEAKVSARFMIADTPLGHDAAVLIDAGCLRISHGFSPIDYMPLRDDAGKDLGGWHIQKYAMMETSVVSIPSNIDGEIDAFSRGKLHHPLVKAWCKMLSDGRKKFFAAHPNPGAPAPAAPTEIKLTIDVKGLTAAAAAVPPKKKAKDDSGGTQDDEDDDEEEGKTGKKPKKDDPPADDDDDKGDEDDDDDEPAKKDDEEEGKSKGKVLGELIDGVRELATREDLPKEASGRLGVVNGLLEDIEAGISASADAISEAAKSRDLAGMFSAMGDLVDACVGQLKTVGEEVERICGIDGVPDEVSSGLGDIKSQADAIVEGVGAMSRAADDAGGDDDPNDPADDDEGKDDPPLDDADLDDDDDKDDDDSDLEDDDDDKDDDDEEEKADDDEEDKADDDDDRDEKDDDEEEEKDGDMGGQTLDPSEANPGIHPDEPAVNVSGGGRSAKPGRKGTKPETSSPQAEMDRLLGRHLTGEDVGPEALAALRRAYGSDLVGSDKPKSKKKSTKRDRR